jgi:hypothetical protein
MLRDRETRARFRIEHLRDWTSHDGCGALRGRASLQGSERRIAAAQGAIMGTANSRFLSLFYRAINIYLGIGLLLSFPVFMSFLISTPILVVRLIEGHATLGYVLTVGVFFPLFGLVTATWRMLSWPFIRPSRH